MRNAKLCGNVGRPSPPSFWWMLAIRRLIVLPLTWRTALKSPVNGFEMRPPSTMPADSERAANQATLTGSEADCQARRTTYNRRAASFARCRIDTGNGRTWDRTRDLPRVNDAQAVTIG